jgi:hypothetical protein
MYACLVPLASLVMFGHISPFVHRWRVNAGRIHLHHRGLEVVLMNGQVCEAQ